MKQLLSWCRPGDWWRFLKWLPGALFGPFNKAHYQAFERVQPDGEEGSLAIQDILERIFMGKQLTPGQEEAIAAFARKGADHRRLVEEFRDPRRLLRRMQAEARQKVASPEATSLQNPSI